MDQMPPSPKIPDSSESSLSGPGSGSLSEPVREESFSNPPRADDDPAGPLEGPDKKYRTEEDSKKKKGWLFGLGCVGCGLIGCLGTVVISVALFFFGIFWFADNILSKTPLEVPPVYLSEEETSSLEKRISSFKEAVDKSKPATLELTDKELNYIFQKDPDKSGVRMSVVFNKDDTATFMMSVVSKGSSGDAPQQPMYMNLSGTGTISVTKGKFNTDFTKLKVGKIDIPGGDFLKGFSQGIGEEVDKNEQYQKLNYEISELKISDGKVTVVTKPKTGAPKTDVETPSTESPSPEEPKEDKDEKDDDGESGKGIKLD